MRVIDKIILHCSDSAFGDAATIDAWHKDRGWKKIGYHYVITNGHRMKDDEYLEWFDGHFQLGRLIEEIGAHATGDNSTSVGICLIGRNKFSQRQFETARFLIRKIEQMVGKQLEVIGHYETNSGKAQGKTCPNFDMDEFREKLKGYRNG